MSSAILRQELLNDPLSVGYAGMTDAQVLASITDASGRSKPNRGSLSSAEIYDVVDRTERRNLSADDKAELRVILGLGDNIDISNGSKARAELAAMFGAGTTTRAGLLALVDGLTQSRAAEIGVKKSQLTETGIAAARIMQP